MVVNIDKFVTDPEHMVTDHTGLPGVGGGGGGAFTDLSDTPSAPLTNTSLFRVDGGGNLVEFTTPNINWVPETGTQTLGSAAAPWQNTFTRTARITNPGTGTVTPPVGAGDPHLIMAGLSETGGSTTTVRVLSNGVFMGYAYSYNSGSTYVRVGDAGTICFGKAYGYDSTANITTYNDSSGSLVGGNASAYYGGTAVIKNTAAPNAEGAFLHGLAQADGTGGSGTAEIIADTDVRGGMVRGAAIVPAAGLGTASIRVGAAAGTALGFAHHNAVGDAASSVKIETTHAGGLSFGYVEGAQAGLEGFIRAGGLGCAAWGHVSQTHPIRDGQIWSNQSAAVAWGYIDGGGDIFSTSDGAMAFGRIDLVPTALGDGGIRADNAGSLVFGDLRVPVVGSNITYAELRTTGRGSLAHGHIDDGAAGRRQIIRADGAGSTAAGVVEGTPTSNDPTIRAEQNGSFAQGSITDGGAIRAIGQGAQSHGDVRSCTQGGVVAQARGSQAFGYVMNCTTQFNGVHVDDLALGGHAHGWVNGDGVIRSFNLGAHASGRILGTGNITANGNGSRAFGTATSGTIETGTGGDYGHGALAFGEAGSGTIRAYGYGSCAFGYLGGAGLIEAGGYGAMAFGYSTTGTIEADGEGSFAFGYCYAGYTGQIRSSSTGSFAGGYSYNATSTVTATGAGAISFGNALYGSITAADGAVAFGGTGGGYDISATGRGSLAIGDSTTAAITASATNTWQFGPGTNSTVGSLQVGTAVSLNTAGFMQLNELGSAPTGTSDAGRIFTEDNGGGKTRLMVQFGTGAAQQLAIEP